jgi:hypothetical protein
LYDFSHKGLPPVVIVCALKAETDSLVYFYLLIVDIDPANITAGSCL